jgi:hypothetical protein
MFMYVEVRGGEMHPGTPAYFIPLQEIFSVVEDSEYAKFIDEYGVLYGLSMANLSNVNNLVADDDGRLSIAPAPAPMQNLHLDALATPQSVDMTRKKVCAHVRACYTLPSNHSRSPTRVVVWRTRVH